ncbi:MAG: hypothetical protein RQ723_12400 [Desulfuromonadales bacterium]|nr:hypothetical protein [Desulfuromonadales bacterium]
MIKSEDECSLGQTDSNADDCKPVSMRPEKAASGAATATRDRLEVWSFIAQIVTAVAVIGSLVFVWVELERGNRIAIRAEANATMSQWSDFRSSIYGDADVAGLLAAGLAGDLADTVDQMRFDYLLREHAWATYNVWDRAEKGLLPSVHFSDGAGPDFLRLLCTPGGAKAWARIRSELPPPYVEELDRLAGPYADEYAVSCSPLDGLEQS